MKMAKRDCSKGFLRDDLLVFGLLLFHHLTKVNGP